MHIARAQHPELPSNGPLTRPTPTHSTGSMHDILPEGVTITPGDLYHDTIEMQSNYWDFTTSGRCWTYHKHGFRKAQGLL